jgi:hypothetical protein
MHGDNAVGLLKRKEKRKAAQKQFYVLFHVSLILCRHTIAHLLQGLATCPVAPNIKQREDTTQEIVTHGDLLVDHTHTVVPPSGECNNGKKAKTNQITG